jgi:hypothetical protein
VLHTKFKRIAKVEETPEFFSRVLQRRSSQKKTEVSGNIAKLTKKTGRVILQAMGFIYNKSFPTAVPCQYRCRNIYNKLSFKTKIISPDSREDIYILHDNFECCN